MRRQIEDCAYIVHRRAFQNSSLIVHFFSQQHGLLSAVAKGAQTVGKNAKRRFELAFFCPLAIRAIGSGTLLTLQSAEPVAAATTPCGKALWCALYLNELLMHFAQHSEDARFFWRYQQSVQSLAKLADNAQQLPAAEVVLRAFELELLDLCGYGIDFAVGNQALLKHHRYFYQPNQGFSAATTGGFGGDVLLRLAALKNADIANVDLLTRLSQDHACLQAGKKILRSAIGAQMGNKTIKARSLFQTSSAGV